MSNYFLYLVLGILPSTIWLLFYLKKDVHPEPTRKILEVFFRGAVAAVLAALIEIVILKGLLALNPTGSAYLVLYIFLGIALIEESLKYLAVRQRVFSDPEFDEPLDAIVYMIIASLGFAALENIFLFFSENLQVLETVLVSGLRFVGATLLHTLCSGTFGYFIALSFLKNKKRPVFFLIGFLTATALHGLYNFFIMEVEGHFKLVGPVIILSFLASFLSFGFKRLKKMKSVCEINS